MTDILRMRVLWNGGPGGAGVSTFHALSATTLVAPMITFLNAVKANLPNDITLSVPSGGDTVDSVTGDLTGSWGDGTYATITGAVATGFAAASGFLMKWGTGAIVNGHRLVGKTYIVPAASICFDVDGNVLGATRSGMITAASALIAANPGNLIVWSRPSPTHSGEYRSITTGDVNLKGCILRSRRD
jgi:hypothetical protein